MVAAKGKLQPPTGEVEGGSKEEKASANDEKAPSSKKRKFEAPAGGGRGGGGGGSSSGGRGFFPNRGKSAGDRDSNNYTAVNALKRIKLKVYIHLRVHHLHMYVCMRSAAH